MGEIETHRLPMLYLYCEKVYEAMLAGSEQRGEDKVWIGLTGDLIDSIQGIPKGYYGKITNALRGMACVQQIRRGGGSPPMPSEWLLKQPPAYERFDAARRSTNWEPPSVVVQKVNDTIERVTLHDGQLERVFRLMSELGEKIQKLTENQDLLSAALKIIAEEEEDNADHDATGSEQVPEVPDTGEAS